MTRNTTRRKLLRCIGASSIVGLAGQASAESAAQSSSPQPEPTPGNNTFPSDILIHNHAKTSVDFQLNFYEMGESGQKASTDPITTQQLDLGPAGDQPSKKKINTSLDKGIYIVEATSGEGRGKMVIGVSEGGIPDWKRISTRLLPNDTLDIFLEEL